MRWRGGIPLGLLLAVAPLQGQTPQLTMEVDTAFVTVGDRIALRISVDHPSDSQLFWPDSLDLEPFEILEVQTTPTISLGDGARSLVTLFLTAFEVGNLEIPSFQVGLQHPDGETTTLATNPFGIQVTSVGLDEGGDIREVKGPLGIPMGLARILLLALATILIPALAYAIYRKMANKGSESSARVPIHPPRPPHELALEALARLEASPLLAIGEVKEFHIQASDILRSYLEGRFRVSALEMTTGDIVAGMGRAGIEPEVSEGFRAFLHPCDMVKFAKNRPSADASLALLERGRKLVEGTALVPAHGTEDQPLPARIGSEATPAGLSSGDEFQEATD